MKNCHIAKLSLSCLLCGLVVLGSCCINVGCWPRAKYERTERFSSPISPGDLLDVETDFGSITVAGDDVTDVNVIADICTRAPTAQEAQELAERVQILLQPAGKTLEVKTKKPSLENNRSIRISFNITVPKQTSLKCHSSYGSINLANIHGDIEAETSYGSIESRNIEGSVRLETAYGQITCRDIASNHLTARSSYGSINIACSPSAPAEMSAKVVTSYGSISFSAPPGFAGQVDMGTGYGSIKTDLPVTVKGEISKKRIKGIIGQGSGNLHLRTSYGSIKVR